MPGGMPGGRGGRAARPEADTTKLYELLGVAKDADASEIKKVTQHTTINGQRNARPWQRMEAGRVRMGVRALEGWLRDVAAQRSASF